ncbi:MAG: HesA/MoeB/ThiF family protein [Bacteroidales bacterium]|nr:HesA/MoeB/ThiF family protein [Candidatus Liminaster caballi]
MTPEQKRRYNRHIILDGFGSEGQQRLLESKVLIVGAGGLGSPCALYLAAAGVGTIGIADADTVSISNLQRQVIHFSEDAGTPKALSAKDKMQRINPDIRVEAYPTFITAENAPDIIRQYDFIIDCTDSFASKYLINDACVMLGKPFCIAGIVAYSGQIMTHVPGSACYRCLFPAPPPENEVQTCSMVGVLGSAVGTVGTLQATEAIKVLTGIGSPLTNAILTYDALTVQFQRFDIQPNPNCMLCGSHPSVTELQEYSFQPCRKNTKE